MSTDPLREVGGIGRAHGVQGEVYVTLITDRTERLAPGARLLAGEQWLTVVASRQQQQRWLVHFEGVDDRTTAEKLTNTTLRAQPLDDLDVDDALWVHELIGARVVDTAGVERGTCAAVIDNPAHDILELDNGALIPVTFVVSCIDGVVTIDPPEGLFDL
ncbi:MAG TPA: ribosome maturation factor RimM [Ilumatobacteraceae bacterium]